MEGSVVYNFWALTSGTNFSILDVCKGPDYASALRNCNNTNDEVTKRAPPNFAPNSKQI